MLLFSEAKIVCIFFLSNASSRFSLNLNSYPMSDTEETVREGGDGTDPSSATGKKEFRFPDEGAFESFKKENLLPALQEEEGTEANNKEGKTAPIYIKIRRVSWLVGMAMGLTLLYFQGTGWMLYFLAYGGLVWFVIDVQRPRAQITAKPAFYLLGAFAFPLFFSGWVFWLLFFYSFFAFLLHELGGRMALEQKEEEEAKENIIRKWLLPTLEWMDRGVRFDPHKGFSQESVQDSFVFPFKGKHFSSEAYFHGNFDGLGIEFAEISLSATGPDHDGILSTSREKKERFQKFLHGKEANDEMFRGLFVILHLEKKLSCSLQVRPSSFEWTMEKRGASASRKPDARAFVFEKVMEKKAGGSAGPKESDETWLMDYDPTKRRMEEDGREAAYLELEDEKFDERFKVYSPEREKARELLSGSMKERILELQEQWGEPIFLSVQGDRLHLALEMKDGFFDPEVFSGDLKEEEEALDRFYYGLERIHALAREFGSVGMGNGRKGKES